jgi:hypothetical protein
MTRTGLPELSEREFQRQVTDMCELFGWEWHHQTLSIYSKRGWPDLALMRERFMLFELKTENGQPTYEQYHLLELLQNAGVEAYLFRPSDFEEIAEILRHRTSPARAAETASAAQEGASSCGNVSEEGGQETEGVAR